MKTLSKTLCATAVILCCAGFSGCKCNADDSRACDAKDAGNPNCNCPVLLVVGEDEEQIGDCTVCTVWSEEYKPCMNALAACPAIAKQKLKDAPLCKKCKDMIMAHTPRRKACAMCGKEAKPCAACTEKLHNMKVRDLMCADSMKANMNCPECKKTAMEAAKKKANSTGQKKNDNDDTVIVVEEVDAVVVPAPAPDAKKAEPQKK